MTGTEALIALAAASAVVGAGSAVATGMAQKKAADANARALAERARTEREAAAFEERRHRAEVEKIRGRQRAAFAASGIDPGSGSPLEVMAQTTAEGELDALAIRYGGEVRARGSESSAAIQRFQGRAAQAQGFTGAASSLLKGASAIGGILNPPTLKVS